MRHGAAEGFARGCCASHASRRARRAGCCASPEQQREHLLAAHAPVLEVQTTGDYDRLGHPRLDARALPSVDISRPVLFGRVAWTRYGEQSLVQLVYTGWFPERPREGSFDILAGALDGMLWRVTLGPDGAPLVYDTIHPCGCYHMFFPTSRAQARTAPDPDDEWAFVPAALGALPADARIRIRIATRTHYLVDVSADAAGSAPATRYTLADENGLRALPPAGRRYAQPVRARRPGRRQRASRAVPCSGRWACRAPAACANGAGTPRHFSAEAFR